MAVKFEDYYETLGVKRDAAPEQIKRAYRKLAQKYHPDRNDAADASDKFSKVSEAYEVLKDPEKRKLYDRYGENYKAGQDFRPPPGFEGFDFGGRAGGQSAGGGFHTGGDFSDFFRQVFGGDPRGGAGGTSGGGFDEMFGGGHSGGASGGGARTQAPPREQEAELSISLHEAYHGTTRQLHISDPTGGTKKIDVKVPPRMKPGGKIRLKGEHLLLKINVAPDPRFGVEGANLTADLKITPALAALGGKADVETLDGMVTMTIPVGIASGSKLRVRGKGLGKDGDLLVRVLVNVPQEPTDEQRKLYEQLRDLDST